MSVILSSLEIRVLVMNGEILKEEEFKGLGARRENHLDLALFLSLSAAM